MTALAKKEDKKGAKALAKLLTKKVKKPKK